MRSFWSDPYLWIHLSGLAVVPLWLGICLLGFAVGDPVFPVWLEVLLVAAIGIAPVLWMQWQRPFYIFSLVAVALQPNQLTDDERRLLTLFKSQRNQLLAAIVPVLLVLVLYQVYGIAPIAASIAPFPAGWRLLGLLLAAVAFLAVNLFTQVPVSVLSVMLHSDSVFSTTNPYPLEQIRQSFSLIGLGVKQILPPMIAEPPAAPPAVVQESAPISAPEVAPELDGLEKRGDEAIAPEPSPTDSVESAQIPPEANLAEPPTSLPEEPPAQSASDEDIWE